MAEDDEPLTGPERAKQRAQQAREDQAAPNAAGPGAGGAGGMGPSSQAQRQQAYKQFEIKLRVQETLEDIDHVLCVMSGKGGVGKSTVAVNLAVALARQGVSTGLADFDLTNPNDHTMLGLRGEHLEAYDEERVAPKAARENLKVVSTGFLVEGDAPVAWRGPIKTGAIRQFLADIVWGKLDVLVVDLPPGTSDEALSVAQTFPRGTPALLVTTPQETSYENVRQNVRFCEHAGMDVVGIVENFAGLTCPHCHEGIDVFPGDASEQLADLLDVPVVARLPLEPAVGRSQDQGVPAVEMDPQPETGQLLTELAASLIKRLSSDEGPST